MRFRDDTRGVTVQVGAVLLFATIIIALSVYQATVVPAENADVEYRHSQQVQGQLVDVRNALVSTAETGNARPATVSLGTEYPNRVFLVNPPPAAGTLRTDTYDGDPAIEVSNVNATNDETRDYLDGSWTQPTKGLSFVPGYNEYRDAPRLRYEASLLSNYYPEQNTSVPLTDQLLVDEQTRTVSLVALNGSLSTSRSSSVAVNPSALSAPAQRVQVQADDSGQPVTVTIPTVVNASVLRNSTNLGGMDNVTVVQNGSQRVTLSVDWDEPFTLRTAKVGVGSGATNPPSYYLTLVESDDDSVTVEARDEYNNPVSGELVSTTRPDVFEDEDGEKRTSGEGRVTFDALDGWDTDAQFLLVDGAGDLTERTVNASVDTATGVPGSGSGGSVVYQNDSASFDGQDGDSTTGGFNFSVRNDFASGIEITDVTVLPEDDTIDGLSDAATGEGFRQSELYVENTTGASVTVDVPTTTGEYAYVGPRGLTLSLKGSRTERTSEPGSGFSTSETDVIGNGLVVGSGENATIEIGEFHRDTTTDSPETVNATDEDFRVVVSYERDEVRASSEFVIYPGTSSSEGGGGGGNDPSVTIEGISNSGSSGQFRVGYTANANGDDDLQSVSVEAVSWFGETLSDSTTVTGETASGNFRLRGSQTTFYTVTVTVTDSEGNTASDTEFHFT